VTHIPDFISNDYTEVFNGKRYEVGLEGAIAHIEGIRNNYLDLKLVVEHQIAENDWVATCYTMTGIHAGNWLGMLPTGKAMSVTGVNTDKIRDGKIVEHGSAANMFEAFLEIGDINIAGKEISPG
jgi:predicted ester cyclase